MQPAAVEVGTASASAAQATPKRPATSRKRTRRVSNALDITAGAQAHENNDTCCSICALLNVVHTHLYNTGHTGLDDEIAPANKAVVDGCSHAFCLSCLRDWIRYKPERPLCPLCKRAIAGYTHGYDKLGRGASKPPKVQGAGTEDQPFELLDDDDAAGPSSQPPTTADIGEFCLEHTVVQPRSGIELAVMGGLPGEFHDLAVMFETLAANLLVCTW